MNETKPWRIGWRTREAEGVEIVNADTMDEAIEIAAIQVGFPSPSRVSWTAQVIDGGTA